MATITAERLSIEAAHATPARTSILKRLCDAFVGWQLRRAEREVIREFAKRGYLADRGSFGDRFERQIQDRILRDTRLF